jgi:hypothetical protein
MESMACDIVLDITSPSRLELSITSSLFLGAFLGAVISALDQKPVYIENVYKTR